MVAYDIIEWYMIAIITEQILNILTLIMGHDKKSGSKMIFYCNSCFIFLIKLPQYLFMRLLSYLKTCLVICHNKIHFGSDKRQNNNTQQNVS